MLIVVDSNNNYMTTYKDKNGYCYIISDLEARYRTKYSSRESVQLIKEYKENYFE